MNARPEQASSLRAIGYVIAVVVLIFDQLIKAVVSGRLALPQRRVIEILPFFDLR